jgi:hypothetical protein
MLKSSICINYTISEEKLEEWVYFDPKKHFHKNVLKNLEIISVISHGFIG